MALDSILSTPIIPPPQKSANSAASGSSAPGNGLADAIGAGTSNGVPADNSTNSDTGGSRTPTTGGKSNSASGPRSKQAAPQAAQSATTRKTGAKGNAGAQQANGAPGSFLQALAQSQADVAVTVDPAATAAAEQATEAATDKDKKPASSDDSNASSSSLAFISQSLAAAIAGVQQPNASQGLAAAPDSAESEGDATEAVSSAGGGTGALQNLVANLAKDTANGLKATADATSLASGPKSDTAANTASGASDASAAVSAFQAHMSVGSHFQQASAADTNPNRLDSPVGSPEFNDELGGKVTWLANQGIQSASLQLTPEHLGPVNVHISVQDGTASVSFNAAHADTRAALEQALPRLREMFATNGLTLSDANVSHQSPRGQPQKQSISAIGSAGGVSDDTTSSTVTSVAARRLGLLDTYA